MGANMALRAVEMGARTVILGHLSKENNTPRMARDTVESVFAAGGVRVGNDVSLSVAPRDECGGWIEV
jgi:phosphoribosyl 1,2-cyclic phosphodiesterase